MSFPDFMDEILKRGDLPEADKKRGETAKKEGLDPLYSRFFAYISLFTTGIIALRRAGHASDNGVKYRLGDHLGSTSTIVDQAGLALPAHYPLLDNDADTIYFFDSMYDTTPVHESAHIIDYRSGYVSVDMAKSVDLGRSPTEYGKTNRLEDFAESWKIWIYDKPGLTGTRRSFIENLIVQWR